MDARIELKHRLILTAMIGLGGAVWSALLGFGLWVVALVMLGAMLPIWLMSRTSMLEPGRRPPVRATILDELEAQQALRPSHDAQPAEAYVLTRARKATVFANRSPGRSLQRHASHAGAVEPAGPSGPSDPPGRIVG